MVVPWPAPALPPMTSSGQRHRVSQGKVVRADFAQRNLWVLLIRWGSRGEKRDETGREGREGEGKQGTGIY